MSHDTCFPTMGILTSVDSDEPVQPPFKLRNLKWGSVSSLTVIEFLSERQRLLSDCAYAQVDLRLCWLHILHCWKSHATAHMFINWSFERTDSVLLVINNTRYISVQKKKSKHGTLCNSLSL